MMKRPMYKTGGKTLKPVNKKKSPGLAKLPKKVRNKKGFMKKGGKECTVADVRHVLTQHIGLETNGSVSTRHKYIVNIAKNLANDIDYKLSNEDNK